MIRVVQADPDELADLADTRPYTPPGWKDREVFCLEEAKLLKGGGGYRLAGNVVDVGG